MPSFESPFLAMPVSEWLCSNDLAFAVFDGFPVSPGPGAPEEPPPRIFSSLSPRLSHPGG